MNPAIRLWRARRRHDQMEATLARDAGGWRLQFFRNDRVLLTRRHAAQAGARKEANQRLRDLLRVGWVDHW